MDAKHLPYVHLLLYRCNRCFGPIALSIMRHEANLEKIDVCSGLLSPIYHQCQAASISDGL